MPEKMKSLIEQIEEVARTYSFLAKDLKKLAEGDVTDEKIREAFNVALNRPLRLEEAEEQVKELIDYIVNMLKEARNEQIVFVDTSYLRSLSELLYSIADLISLYQKYRVYEKEHLAEKIYDEIEKVNEKL